MLREKIPTTASGITQKRGMRRLDWWHIHCTLTRLTERSERAQALGLRLGRLLHSAQVSGGVRLAFTLGPPASVFGSSLKLHKMLGLITLINPHTSQELV